MTLGQNGVLRYGHFGEFLDFFWDRMANLGLIDFKLGLYIKVDVNTRQNKFEVHISKIGQNGHQLAKNRPDATLARSLPMVITWPFFIQF